MNLIDEEGILELSGKDPIQLEEGRSAYVEAIEHIKRMPKATNMQPLLWSELLERAAIDHQQDLMETGDMGAIGSDGSTYKERIEKYCRWGGSIFQALDFGPRQAPVEVVIAWIVDDGNPKRTSRTNMFSVKQRHFAASFGEHIDAENCCIGIYAA